MKPTSPSEVFNPLAGSKAGKSYGLANIPSFLLKTAAVVIRGGVLEDVLGLEDVLEDTF